MSRPTTEESPRHDDAGDAAILAHLHAYNEGVVAAAEQATAVGSGLPSFRSEGSMDRDGQFVAAASHGERVENERLAMFPVMQAPPLAVGTPVTMNGEPIGTVVGVDMGSGPDQVVTATLRVDGSTITARLGSPSGFNANGDSVSPAAVQDQVTGRLARQVAEDEDRRVVDNLISAFGGDRVRPQHFSMQYRELGATPNQNGDDVEPGALPVPPASETMTLTSHRYRLPRTPTVARASQALRIPSLGVPAGSESDAESQGLGALAGLQGMALQQAYELVSAGVTRAEIAAVVELGGTDALDRLYRMSGGDAHAFRGHATAQGAAFPPATPNTTIRDQGGSEVSALNFDIRQILFDNMLRDQHTEDDRAFFSLTSAVVAGDLSDVSAVEPESAVDPLAQWRELAEQLAPTNAEDDNAVQLWRSVSLDPRTALECLAPEVEGVTYEDRARQAVSILEAIQQLHEAATASGNSFTASSAIQALTHLALGGDVLEPAAAKVPHIWSAAHKAGRAVFVESKATVEEVKA